MAYSTAEPTHRINVPAARMQLAGDEEGAFDHWYRHQPAFTVDVQALRPDGSVYPQRGQFGRYVAQRFADAAASSGGRLRHLRDRALAFHQGMVTTDGGLQLKADLLVLAISHPPPSLPAQAEARRHHPALIANPWQPRARCHRPARPGGGDGHRINHGRYGRDAGPAGPPRQYRRLFAPWPAVARQP
ncbi:hypothetical protein KPZU09_67360 [Klebsiella pneumoniae]|uniref:FAD-dependent urate hydroxylase HpyO/Asp monooxygenase CreE-like FAD/NAD(P)-binding domain-containing protein n=1 Tax=Klebsiella pneumoniae TaxID=573 RepID=A0A919HZL6_KLEPN|nr:hypothetical protein KPZU09_67360 [Klebsiella pneumoniae]